VRKAVLALALVAALWAAPGAFAAGWCGNDVTRIDRPDVLTGQQVHAIVAVPADAPDTFTAEATQLADDITSIDGWWRAQDPTRAPRWDQAAFPTGRCLDISLVRLPDPAAAYAGAGSSFAFGHLADALETAGLESAYKKYVVYFDGPSVEQDICGTGGGDFLRGPSYAVVWLQGCVGVPNDAVAAHELLHALGALPDGAPNACPLAQGGAGHPCDSVHDIIYPFTTGDPLSTLILDVNHDDYYAHGGSWDDIQDSSWLEHLDAPKVPLGVAFSGAGEIKSDVPGVDCTAACTTQWEQGAALALTAVPAKTDRFVRWSGSCAGRGDCSLKLDQAANATAVFGPLRIAVRTTTAGRGTIACSPRCTKSFPAGNSLSLRAVAAKGWRFTGWTGGCKGAHLTCAPATDFAVSVRATFRRR
jgi:Divergent InlB B-repeat domain